MIKDEQLVKAVAAIAQRSERQPDLQKLVGAFVDVGILPQVQSRNNQIIFGRRGTGKTHILRVLGSNVRSPRVASIYIDARTLGSTAQFTDNSVPLSVRCVSLFRDVLGEIRNALLDHIVNIGGEGADHSLDELNEMGRIATEAHLTRTPDSTSTRILEKATDGSSVGVSLSVDAAKIEGSSKLEGSREQEETVRYSVTAEDKIIFPAVSHPIRSILERTDSQLFILVDEWSSLPADVQPYLAEFFKRTLLPLSRVTVKIAALEHRSVFSTQKQGSMVGFELGADISAGIDIDDYYVFDRDPNTITDAFGEMLANHLRNELPEGYLAYQLGITTGRDLASKLFTERAVFQELVRASEGVARDLLNIFSSAFFSSHRKGRDKIERAAVLEGARQWFEQDKEGNLDDTLRLILRRITDEVIGERRARSFLLPRGLGDHPLVQRLFDLRVLHLVLRGYADKDKPGIRYNIYSLDYGTYVDLMNTSRRPDLGFLVHEPNTEEFVVPFDDKRSIRRIILTEKILSTTT